MRLEPAANTGNTNPSNPTTTAWTADRIRALGPVTDLPTAAKILRIGRALAYQMARDNVFPVPTIRVGTRYRVPVAPLLDVLHLTGGDDLTPPVERSVDQPRQPGETRSDPTDPDTTVRPQ